MRVSGIVILAFSIILAGVFPAFADIYLKVDRGTYIVTNEPKDQSYVKVVDQVGEESVPEADQIQEAVEYAAGEFRLPETLIFSILRSYRGNQYGLLMPLPPGYIKNHGETITRKPKENIRVSMRFFQQMLRRYEGNMVLTLAAYYAGPDAVDQVNGIPPDPQVQSFIEKVRSTFDQFESRETIIYSYRDEDGTLHIANIR